MLLVASFSSCGKKDPDQSSDNKPKQKTEIKVGTRTNDSSLAKSGVFSYKNFDIASKIRDTGFPLSDGGVDSSDVVGDKVYFIVHGYNYENYADNSGYFLCSASFDGGDLKAVRLMASPHAAYIEEQKQAGELQPGEGEPADDGQEPSDDNGEGMDFDPGYEGDSTYKDFAYDYVRITKDGGAVGICDYTFNDWSDPENEVYMRDSYFCSWDSEGNETACFSLGDLTGDDGYINNAILLDDGNYAFFVCKNDKYTLYKVSPEGELSDGKEMPSTESWVEASMRMVCLNSGDILTTYYNAKDNWRTYFAYLDGKTLSLKKSVPVPDSEGIATSGVTGIDKDGNAYFANGTGIVKYNPSTGADPVEFFNVFNSALDGNGVDAFVPINDKKFFGFYTKDTSEYSDSFAAAVFDYVDPSTLPDKNVVTIGIYGLDGDIRSRITEYNKTSNENVIVIKDYSNFGTNDDYNAGVSVLNTDILSGKMPDILYMSQNQINYNIYAKKGLLADVDNLIANDEELSGYSYLDNVFNAFRFKDTLYTVVPSFNIMTFAVKTEFFPGKTTWTGKEFLDFAKSLPAGEMMLEGINREDFLDYLLRFNGNEFVDIEKGTCNFDSDDFISMLEFSKTLPEEINYDDYDDDYWMNYQYMWSTGKVKTTQVSMYNAHDYHVNMYSTFMGDYTTIGFPTSTGCGNVISSGNGFALCADSANLLHAWDFVRYYLTPDYQNSLIGNWGIPVMSDVFDKWAENGKEKGYWLDENGEKQYYDESYWVGDQQFEIPMMNNQQVEDLKTLIKSADRAVFVNPDISAIVEEEASAFYAGSKSAQDVAKVIQSRVSMYVLENM